MISSRSFEYSLIILMHLLFKIWLMVIEKSLRLLKTSKLLILLFKIHELILVIVLLGKASDFELTIIVVYINILSNVLHYIGMYSTRILKILIFLQALWLSLTAVLFIEHVLKIKMLEKSMPWILNFKTWNLIAILWCIFLAVFYLSILLLVLFYILLNIIIFVAW